MSHITEVNEYLQSLYEEDELLANKMLRIENELEHEDLSDFDRYNLTCNYETMALRRKELSKEIDLEQEYYDSHWGSFEQDDPFKFYNQWH